MNNNFVWCDLSVYKLQVAMDFYSKVFGWTYYKTTDISIDEDYHIAYMGSTPVSAIFTMPSYLQKLNLPSFWMSYIQVDNIDLIVEKAKTHQNVIIEVKPTAFDEKSRIALIRDPSGAGFTIYEGEKLNGRFSAGHGKMIWNVHHVNDLSLVKDFYDYVFGWSFELNDKSSNNYFIKDTFKNNIGSLEVISSDIKGDYQYWMPVFEIQNQDSFLDEIIKMEGVVVMSLDDSRTMCQDPQGGSFIVQENNL